MRDQNKCSTCGKPAHNFEIEEAMNCIPPKEVLQFGDYIIDENYRKALFKSYPMYTCEEVVGSYLGYNPNFPDEDDWLSQQEQE